MPAGCPALDMVAHMPSGAAVAGPVALAATESVSAVAAAAAAVELHMKYYAPGRHAGLEWDYPAEVEGIRRVAFGTRYNRAGRIYFDSTHIPAVGRLAGRSRVVAVPVHATRSVGWWIAAVRRLDVVARSL